MWYGICNGSCVHPQDIHKYYYHYNYSYCSYTTYYDCGRTLSTDYYYYSDWREADHTGPCPAACHFASSGADTGIIWIVTSMLFLLIIVSIVICACCHHKNRESSSATRNLGDAKQSKTNSHDADAPFLVPEQAVPPRLTLEAKYPVRQRTKTM